MLAIKNVKLYTITKGASQGGVLIDNNGKIAAVGEISIPEEATVIDGDGKILMPGIIDAHGHAGLFEEGLGPAGVDVNESVDPVTPHLRAIDGISPDDEGISEALAAGVTSMCVMPGSANVLCGEGVVIQMYGNTVEDMIIKESGGLKVAFGENPKKVYSEQKKSPATRMAVAAILRDNLVKAQNYMEKIERGKLDPDKKPERDLKMDMLVRVLNKEMPLRAHAHRADDIMTAIRIAEEFDVDITVEHCTEGHKVAEELAKRNIATVVGPTMTTRSKVELKNRSFATLVALWESGVLVALTTDHPVIHVRYLPIAAALAVKAGLPEEEALKALTINPAKILGLADNYGSIEVGKIADLVLWSGDPLDIRSEVDQVLIKGDTVYQR